MATTFRCVARGDEVKNEKPEFRCDATKIKTSLIHVEETLDTVMGETFITIHRKCPTWRRWTSRMSTFDESNRGPGKCCCIFLNKILAAEGASLLGTIQRAARVTLGQQLAVTLNGKRCGTMYMATRATIKMWRVRGKTTYCFVLSFAWFARLQENMAQRIQEKHLQYSFTASWPKEKKTKKSTLDIGTTHHIM